MVQKREGNGSAFPGGFKGMKLWGEMKSIAYLTKLRTKGVSNFWGSAIGVFWTLRTGALRGGSFPESLWIYSKLQGEVYLW